MSSDQFSSSTLPSGAKPLSQQARSRRTLAMLLIGACTLMLCACGAEPEPEPEPASQSVANDVLGVSFARIPQNFAVDVNEGDRLELRSTVEGDAGRMWIESGEVSDFGIRLVDSVNQQKEIYEARPGGEFNGSRKILTPLGEAYYSRGSFEENGVRVEEARVFTMHPVENRQLTLFYRYPAGTREESGARVQELLVWVGEMEGPPVEGAGTENAHS